MGYAEIEIKNGWRLTGPIKVLPQGAGVQTEDPTCTVQVRSSCGGEHRKHPQSNLPVSTLCLDSILRNPALHITWFPREDTALARRCKYSLPCQYDFSLSSKEEITILAHPLGVFVFKQHELVSPLGYSLNNA